MKELYPGSYLESLGREESAVECNGKEGVRN
jgi:hypothetical protein